MSRTGRFLASVGLGYLHQGLVALVGLWLTPFLLDHIGRYDYGLWLVGIQLTTYLMLVDFGVVALLPRETAYAKGRAGVLEAASDVPEIIGQTARLVLWQMPLVSVAAVVLWFALPSEWETLRDPLGVILLAFVITFPLRIFQAVLAGLQDLVFLGRVQLCVWALSTVLMVGLVLAGLGLYALAVHWVFTQVISALISWHRLRSTFPTVLPTRLPVLSWKKALHRLTQGFWVSAAQVAQVLLNSTDILLIGKIWGPAAAVPFACTAKLISILGNQPQMLMQAAAPALSEMKTSESRQRLFQVATALTQAMFLVTGAVACAVLIVNQGFVGWWVGADLYGGCELTVAFLINMLLRHWNTTAIYSIFCFGYERRISLTILLDGLVTVGGSLILIALLGPIGAPLASTLGVCLVSLPGNLSALARETGVSAAALMRPLWPWFWRFLVLVVMAGAIATTWVPNGFLSLVVISLLTVMIYVMVMLPLALRSPLGIYLRPRLTHIWVRYLRTSVERRANANASN